MTIIPGLKHETTLYVHLLVNEVLGKFDITKIQTRAVKTGCDSIEYWQGETFAGSTHLETWRLCMQASHENVSGHWEKVAKR